MITKTKDLPPVPEKSYLGDDVSYGYEAWDMHAYALEAIRASATSAPEQTEADRKIITLTNQLLELQLLIQRRPAMNIGLFEAYEKWNGECYLLDWMNAVDNATPQPAEGS